MLNNTPNISKRILVVEDDCEFLNSVEAYLSSLGYQIDVSHDGAKARELLETNEYDLVLSDWRIPEMGGIDLLKYVKKACDVPFILMSGFSNFLKQSDKSEASGFLAKPFSPEDLLLTIETCMKKAVNHNGAELNDFTELPIETLTREENLKASLYIPLSTNHFVKVSSPESPLTLERLHNYSKRGVKTLLAKKTS